MSRKIKILGIVCLAVLAVLLTLGSAAKPVPNIQLRATFAEFTDAGIPCTILNDAKGPYMTGGNNSVSVWITGDFGDLFFKFEHHSERSMKILFPYAYSDCGGWLPDTAGLYPDLPDEPIDFFRFQTMSSDSYAPPKANFLTMPAGTPTRVRLWTTFCTTKRHYYFMNYYQTQNKTSGQVEVTAYDTTVPPDGKLDRWVMVPVSSSIGEADIFKHPETGNENINCPFGRFPMPFKLVLERL